MLRPNLAFVAALSLIMPCLGSGYPQQCPEPQRSPFRYAIVHNDQVESSKGETFRIVDVLLDPKSLSESNLTQLFQSLSKQFPKSNRLFVHVHTNLEDVYTPEEASQIMPSVRCNTLRGDKYPWATYNRSDEYEGFDYFDATGSIKTVKLRNKSS